jgi:hypothetical protein
MASLFRGAPPFLKPAGDDFAAGLDWLARALW